MAAGRFSALCSGRFTALTTGLHAPRGPVHRLRRASRLLRRCEESGAVDVASEVVAPDDLEADQSRQWSG